MSSVVFDDFLALDITKDVCEVPSGKHHFGALADVFTAWWVSPNGRTKVALEYLRISDAEGSPISTRLRREIRGWSRLSHLNILEIYGVYKGDRPFPAIVSTWCENGCVTSYLETIAGHPHFDVIQRALIINILQGLQYLHTNEIIHADIRAANVLVSEDGSGKLADFGLAAIAFKHSLSASLRSTARNAMRWMAPEILITEDSAYTFKSDIWSVGCTMVEIFSGLQPYATAKREIQIFRAMLTGQLPYSPEDIGSLSGLTLSCFEADADQRPSIDTLLIRAQVFYTCAVISNEVSFNETWVTNAVSELASAIQGTTDETNRNAHPDSDCLKALQLLEDEQCVTKTAMQCRNLVLEHLTYWHADALANDQADIVRKWTRLAQLSNASTINQTWVPPATKTHDSSDPLEVTQLSKSDIYNFTSAPDLTRNISDVSQIVMYGGFSDVRTAWWNGPQGRTKVALKYIRVPRDGGEALRVLCREINLWAALSHPNVLTLHGLHDENSISFPAMVSTWCEGGHITDYLDGIPTDKLKLVRSSLLINMLEGLQYLHDKGIVHADIKPANILVNGHGTALLADFGLSMVYANDGFPALSDPHGTMRYSAPELLSTDEARCTFASDIWACGCVFGQIASHRVPFHAVAPGEALRLAIISGDPPYHPFDMADLAFLSAHCFDPDPGRRPTTEILLSRALVLYLGAVIPLQVPADETWLRNAAARLVHLISNLISDLDWRDTLDPDSTSVMELLESDICLMHNAKAVRLLIVNGLLSVCPATVRENINSTSPHKTTTSTPTIYQRMWVDLIHRLSTPSERM